MQNSIDKIVEVCIEYQASQLRVRSWKLIFLFLI